MGWEEIPPQPQTTSDAVATTELAPPEPPAAEPPAQTTSDADIDQTPFMPDPGLGVTQEPAPPDTASESPQIATDETPGPSTELPAGPAEPLNPGDTLNQSSAEMLKQALESGDRHAVAAALAAVGVEVTDQVLAQILVPA